MKRDPRLIQQLAQHLERERLLYEKYLRLLEEEKAHIIHFNADQVEVVTEKRANLTEDIVEARDQRMRLLSTVPEGATLPLTKIITQFFHPEDQRKLIPLARKLKSAVRQTQRLTRELGLLTGFSLRLVTGTLSILWSGTQEVTRSYSRKGVMRESYNAPPATAILRHA